ncbi:MAG: hypothetical protein LQ351_002934 [Letrouitia transgressa]|nr:MAG: hypothetical protein LQ351_002934 [Letrouitia transgressa]
MFAFKCKPVRSMANDLHNTYHEVLCRPDDALDTPFIPDQIGERLGPRFSWEEPAAIRVKAFIDNSFSIFCGLGFPGDQVGIVGI